MLLGADDFPGDLAERYGCVNRAIPDAEFDSFVDTFATRVAGFEKQTLAETKAFVDHVTLPDDTEFSPAIKAFFESSPRPGARARSLALKTRGYQQRSDTELNLGQRVAEYREETQQSADAISL